MKKQHYVILVFYAFVTVASIILILFDLLDISWQKLVADLEQFNRFVFSLLFLTVSLSFILAFIGILIYDNSHRLILRNLQRTLNHRELLPDDSSIGRLTQQLSHQIEEMTQQLQTREDSSLVVSQELIKGERNRIARDLHDTVSQELFAASMVISGIATSLDSVDQANLKEQLKTTEKLINTAQNDLRILLLHLRPRELEGRSLVQGFQLLVQELQDKSRIEVSLRDNLSQLPKNIEDNLFRIGQEFISNTLRHAQAQKLEIYLHQTAHEVQLKMSDDGVGFKVDEDDSMSYGLQNIKDRVESLAGSLKLLSEPNQGVTMIVKIPLVKGDD